MSKRFVEYDEFRNELKDLKKGVEKWINESDDYYVKLSDRVDETVKTINQNADAGVELSKRLDSLSERVRALQKASSGLRVDVDAKNSNGVWAACIVGFLGFCGFLYLTGQIDKLQKQLDTARRRNSTVTVTEKPFRETTDSEPGKEM